MLRTEIENLNDLTIRHLMAEDMAFYQFLMLEDALDNELKKLIGDFSKQLIFSSINSIIYPL